MTPGWEVFSAQEESLIKQHYPDFPKLVELLPAKTLSSIRRRACELGLAPFSILRWTSKEDRQVRKYYPDIAKLITLLPHRTRVAIKTRARDLGLARHERFWTSERQEVLAQIAGVISDYDASKIVGGSPHSIAHQRSKMGLTSPPTKGPVNMPLVQDILDIAAHRKIILRKITKALHCGPVKRNLTDRTASIKSLVKVVKALSGDLYVEWED